MASSQAKHQQTDDEQGSCVNPKATEISSTLRSRFLELPPELRNRIYQFAIVADKRIELTGPELKQPALLQASRQIRHEAISIYYGENIFYLEIQDGAGATMVPFRRILLKYNPGSVFGNLVLEVVGTRNWANLLAWLKANYENSRLAPAMSSEVVNPGPARAVIVQAFGIVRTLRGRPWEEVENVLEGYHKGIAALDAGWA